MTSEIRALEPLPPATTPVERTNFGRSVRGFLRLVMIEHSVFALPFAYIALLYTPIGSPCFGRHERGLLPVFGLVTLAMVSARTFAMAVNRLIDRELDARNPRTAQRELVTGALSTRVAWVGAVAALTVFLASAALLNALCLALSPIALALFTLYPYAKRVTWLCHFVLGLAQAMAPVGAWLAYTGRWHGIAPAIWLGVAVGSWVAGFDLIYACQDVESDRQERVYSLPARFGIHQALAVSALLHVATVALLLAFGLSVHARTFWYIGVALVVLALLYEHALVTSSDLSRVNRAFFTVNGFIGIALLVFAIGDVVARPPVHFKCSTQIGSTRAQP